ncbi:MAG: alpha/beta hydrolase fold domain-containing protein [Chitinophagales bacterium]
MLKLCIQILAAASGCIAALLSILLLIRLRWPAPVLWILKLFTSALSPFLFAIGVLCIMVGFTSDSTFISLIGIYNALIFLMHIIRVTSAPDPSGNFDKAFGLHWEARIKSEFKNHFLPARRILRIPTVPDPRIEQNIAYSTIPGTDRKLLCDLWLPPENVIPSGFAFIYLHGSAWYLLDKDLGTRPFFRHLAAQGHVIMDTAYRLAPETDMMGMENDVKRAIHWIKENGNAYQVDPNRIVLGGGSAGAHLALLSAYTSGNPQFTPAELQGKDLGVCAVISLYGPSDLEAMYYHTNQHLTTRSTPDRPKKAVPTKMPAWIIKKMGKDYDRLGMNKGFENAGAFAPLLGGHPDECPETYALFSPVTHVHPGCPPTLLIHGEDDLMAPIIATRFLHRRLTGEKVLSVMHILPQTDHAFDLIQPRISPSAHNAFYDVERFISLMAQK